MRPARVLYPAAGLLFAAAALSPLLAQLASPSASSVSTVTPSTGAGPSPGGMVTTSSRLPTRTLRQILPDPALLDGSKLAPDKYPEYGMIGDFEMPGDEVTDPAQNQRVGASNPNQTQPSAGGAAAKIDPAQKSTGGSAAQAKPDQQGAGGDSQAKAEGAGGAADAAKSAQSAGSNGGGAGGSNTANTKAGGRSPGRNDPNAKAEGIQVGGLNTDESTANSPQIDPTGVPIEIGIGDTANAIKPVAAAAGVTGKESAGTTQQAGKNTAPGGAQSGAGGSSGNRGAERGKTMPSGL